jgi:hypothetical protein
MSPRAYSTRADVSACCSTTRGCTPIVGQQSLAAHIIDGQPARLLDAIVLAAATVAAAVPFLLAARLVLDRDDVLAG